MRNLNHDLTKRITNQFPLPAPVPASKRFGLKPAGLMMRALLPVARITNKPLHAAYFSASSATCNKPL